MDFAKQKTEGACDSIRYINVAASKRKLHVLSFSLALLDSFLSEEALRKAYSTRNELQQAG